VPDRSSNDLHYSSSESSRCMDEQLPSANAASRSANLRIMVIHAAPNSSGVSFRDRRPH
jgi:hypothetical protein